MLKKTALLLFWLTIALPHARAEMIRLQNDSIVEGTIIKEDDQFLELQVKAGTVKIPRESVKTIWRGTKDELLERQGKALHLVEGVKLYKSGKIKNALDEFDQAGQGYGYDPVIHSNLGSAYASLGETQKAEQEFLKALEKEGGSGTVHLNLAELYASQQRCQEAIPHYEKALALGVDGTSFYRNLARCYFAEGRYEKALELYQKSQRQNDAANINNIAAALIQLGKLDEAEELLKNVLAGNRLLPKAFLNMAEIYKRRGDDQNAVHQYKIVLSRKPKNEEARSLLIRFYIEKERFSEAHKEIEKWFELKPAHLPAKQLLAQLLMKQERFDEALEQYGQISNQEPGNMSVLNQIGLLQIKTNRPDQALETYQKILSVDPNNAKAHANAGLAYTLQNNAEQAIKEWEEALRLDQDLKEARENKKLMEEILQGETADAS